MNIEGTYKVNMDGKLGLVIEIPAASKDMQWDITMIGDRFLVFTGESGMSGFVWERI